MSGSIVKYIDIADMDHCDQMIMWGTVVILGLLLAIFILYVKNLQLNRQIQQWDFKYFRLMGRINELEIN